MSLAKLSEHWRFLVSALVIFLAVVVLGPLIMAAFFWVVFSNADFNSSGGVLAIAGALTLFCLGWWSLFLWLGSRRDRSDGAADAAVSGEHHG